MIDVSARRAAGEADEDTRTQRTARGVGRIPRKSKHAWAKPFLAVEWIWEWIAYALSNWTFLEVLDYLETFSVLIAVIFYFSESGDRVKQRHYQAWQVVNTSQGKGGSGGRIEALQELNADGVPLVGVDVSGAFLQGIRLDKARLLRANFSTADIRDAKFPSADFTDADLAPRIFAERICHKPRSSARSWTKATSQERISPGQSGRSEFRGCGLEPRRVTRYSLGTYRQL